MSQEAAVYRTSLRATVWAIVALAVIGAVVGWWVNEVGGLVAALIGVAVAALAGLTTQAAMLYGHKRGGASLAGLVLGSWLVKMLMIIVALLILQGIEDFHRPLFAAFALAGIVATLVIDMWVIQRGRVPYVDQGSKAAEE